MKGLKFARLLGQPSVLLTSGRRSLRRYDMAGRSSAKFRSTTL
jgi:hypothetical protein